MIVLSYLVEDMKKFFCYARMEQGQVFHVKFIVYRFRMILKNTSLEDFATLPMHNVDPTSPSKFIELVAIIFGAALVRFRRNLSLAGCVDEAKARHLLLEESREIE